MEEVHGIALEANSSVDPSAKLKEMRDGVEKLRNRLNPPLRMVPFDPKLSLLFLHAARFHVEDGIARMESYFERKRAFFGTRRIDKDVTPTF